MWYPAAASCASYSRNVFEDRRLYRMSTYFVTTKHVDNIWPANTMPGARFRARNARTPHCRSTLAICTHSPERILPAKCHTRRASRQNQHSRGKTRKSIRTIASSVNPCRAPSSSISLASGTVRKSKSNLVFLHRFLVYVKSGSDGAARANEHAREATSKLQSPRCADGERTPFRTRKSDVHRC